PAKRKDADTSLFARIAPSLALDAFLFLPVNPSYTSTLLKTENRKQKNQSAKSSALWQGGKGRIPGSIHQYVTRNPECGQHRHRVEDDAD
ncbi:TPA: hypothetical protein ACRRYK_003867, partial [Morganella morganii]